MGLIVDFPENDVFVYFKWLIKDFLRSAIFFLLPRIFPDILSHDRLDGEGLKSVASLQLENLRSNDRNIQATLGRMPKVMICHGLIAFAQWFEWEAATALMQFEISLIHCDKGFQFHLQ